ncbi:MAG TPA: acyl-CoA dehydrogenase family protein [Acidimicrobiales bacterium]|nr:acyl-CoA dehydrogenase family protein [Acidimicrobiales bacterium]
MTITDEPTTTGGSESTWVDDLHSFLDDNWDPDLSVGDWWERLGAAGWSAPLLPADAYGRGLNRADAMLAARIIAEHGALGAPVGMGTSLVAPTIVTHGTRVQIDRYLPDIVSGRVWWCQLFSEPGAGSDLAGLGTRAVRDGDVWVINGQKVWTSGGHWADLGMLLARTDANAPKHQGITWFVLDMHQPGVDVRTLREMTGGSMFCEVFFTDATVSDDARIGDANNGWTVANTTLFHERSGMGAGGERGQRLGGPRPGTIADDLGKRAGDFVKARAARPERAESQQPSSPAQLYIDTARAAGKAKDPAIRQALVQSYILSEVQRLNTQRHKAVRAQGGDIPGLPNFSKLLTAQILRHNRDLGLQLLGARGMLHGYDDEQRATLKDVPGGSSAHVLTASALQAQALPIFGGTDQIQRNIVGERVLGLPKEPGDLSRLPWNELPKNG